MKLKTMLLSQQRITPKIIDLNIFKKKNETILKKYISKQNNYWVGSGREALRQILLHLKNNNLNKVGMPAYTCHVVFDTIRRANCEPVFYDSGVIAEIEEIKKIIKKIDVLIVCYNFGFLPEMDKIVELCKKNKVILIEDCAQALGAKYKGKLVGGFGDYAFYSFGISKNIGFCGGMIATNEKLKIPKLKKYPLIKLFKIILEVIISPLFFNKHIYPYSKRLLGIELNKEQEPLNYYLPKFAQKVVLNQLKRYDKILNQREVNAGYCLNKLKSQIKFVKPIDKSNPSWLYFAIKTENKKQFQQQLLKENVEIGEMLTFKCLNQNYKKALKAEEEILTFALYRNIKEIEFIIDKINKTEK